MKTKLYVCTLTIALAAGLAGWGLAHGGLQSVKAASGFSAVSMKGTYGYTLQGEVGATSPLAGVGLLVADGNGGISGTETSQIYGVGMQTTSFQGSYIVNNDGTGTIVINYPVPPSDPSNPDAPVLQAVTALYSFVIVNGLAEMRGIRADNGTIATANFKLQ